VLFLRALLRILLAVGLGCFVIPEGVCADIWDAPTFRYYSSAVEAYNRGEYSKALNLLEASLKDYPDNLLSQYLLAQTLFRLNKDQEALKVFEKTLQLYPNFSEAREAMGAIQEKLGLWNEAAATYRDLVQREPKNPRWPERLAHIALKRGDTKNAETYLRAWLDLVPSSEEAVVLLADLYSKDGRWEQAAKVLEKHYPAGESIAVAMRLGALYFNHERYDEAEPWFVKLLQLQPRSADHHYALGVIAHRRGDKKKAERYFERSLELNSQHFDASYNLGIIRMEQKRYQEALNLFDRCLSIRPQAREPHLMMARIYENVIFDPAKAREHYQKAGINP
jgi:protein O-GlcNAc transferase